MSKRIPDLETAIQRIYKLEERVETLEGQKEPECTCPTLGALLFPKLSCPIHGKPDPKPATEVKESKCYLCNKSPIAHMKFADGKSYAACADHDPFGQSSLATTGTTASEAMPLNAQVAEALGKRVELCCDGIWRMVVMGNTPMVPIPDYLDPANALKAFWTYIIQNHLSAKIHIDPLGSGSIEISGGIVVNFENFATPKDYCHAIVEDAKRRKG